MKKQTQYREPGEAKGIIDLDVLQSQLERTPKEVKAFFLTEEVVMSVLKSGMVERALMTFALNNRDFDLTQTIRVILEPGDNDGVKITITPRVVVPNMDVVKLIKAVR